MTTDADITRAIATGAAALGLDPGERELGQLSALVRMLVKWSAAYNLTAIRDAPRIVPLHILDSLSIAADIDGEAVIDVGTGAGFPGLPLAIVHRARQFTLLDASAKKLRFVRQAAVELGLANVSIEHGRVEHYAAGGRFDTVTVRAFASIGDIVRDCGHLVADGGRIVAMKGRHPRAETDALGQAWHARIRAASIPALDHERHVVILTPVDAGFARSTGTLRTP